MPEMYIYTTFGMYSLGTQLILHEMYLSLRCRIKVHLKCTYEGKCTSHVYLILIFVRGITKTQPQTWWSSV